MSRTVQRILQTDPGFTNHAGSENVQRLGMLDLPDSADLQMILQIRTTPGVSCTTSIPNFFK